MRIIGGYLKGSKLYLPEDDKTRPLKDLVRESIFNLINHSNKIMIKLYQTDVLDVYAGTGSFGLECLSRGSKNIAFIENNNNSIKILEKNIDKLKVKAKTKLIQGDALKVINNDGNFKISDDGEEIITPLPEMENISWIDDLGFKNFDLLEKICIAEFKKISDKANNKSQID